MAPWGSQVESLLVEASKGPFATMPCKYFLAVDEGGTSV